MRVLHINNTSHIGGAARAMQRLHNALVEMGNETQFLVAKSKFPDNSDIHIIWDEVEAYKTIPKSIMSRFGNQFEKLAGINSCANRTTLHLIDTQLVQWADIIELRNLFGGFFNLWSLPSLSAGKPVVWRLPDMWAMTGHCSYPYDCVRWKSGCYNCPLLTKQGRIKVEPLPTKFDGTRRVWNAKKNLYEKSNLHIIVNSKWMGKQVSESILRDALTINVISNGVNLDIYKPYDREHVRKILGLPLNEKILLWIAGGKGNYRKGYHLAIKALEMMQKESGNTPTLLTMGGIQGWTRPEKISKIKHYGYVHDPVLQAQIYSASDGFLCTTLADSQPQTVLESLACGTPVIAFDIGPMADLIDEGNTGYIIQDISPLALKKGINLFYSREDRFQEMRKFCRDQAEINYDLSKQTNEYINLYSEISVNF